MSTFLDDIARTLAQPMPRKRAVRLLGGALVSATVSSVVPRAARATLPCDCSPGENACGIPLGAGCTKVCCVQSSNFPKCCKWIGIAKPAPGCGTHPGGTFGGIVEKPRTVCCCPPNSFCGDIVAGEAHCLTCTGPGRQTCGTACCKQGEFCADSKTSLCCKTGEKGCGNICCDGTQVCRGGTVCQCPTGSKVCGPQLCCNSRAQVCAPRRGRRPPYCCPKPRWMSRASTCCPAGTVGSRTGTPVCCPASNPNCCSGVTCGFRKTCVSGTCRLLL